MYDGWLLRIRRSRDRLLEDIRGAKFFAEVHEKTFSRLPLPPVTEEIVSAILPPGMRISISFFGLGSVPLPWQTTAGLPFTFRELELKAHFPSCLWLVRNLEQVNLPPLRSF